jgi:DNA (cytosine-5)-methyltransferase 1
MNKRTAIDLFSGCGGLTTGLEAAGFKVLACAEIRKEAQSIYEQNHEGVLQLGDITKISTEHVMEQFSLRRGNLDLLAACPPCQGFSSIRTRNGKIAKDARNELIYRVAELVEKLLPKCVLIENVPRLLKDARIEIFKYSLENLGYEFSFGVLNACDFGVPQRRKRMILIASRIGKIEIPIPEGKRKSVRDAIGWILDNEEAVKSQYPLHTIQQKLSQPVIERISKITKSRSELPWELSLPCHQRYPKGFCDVYGRMNWDDVSPTITRGSHNPSKGRFVHPQKNRGLTIFESMLLQGFPRDYKFSTSDGIGKLSSMIGEALPPPMAEAQARHIHRKLDEYERQFGNNVNEYQPSGIEATSSPHWPLKISVPSSKTTSRKRKSSSLSPSQTAHC